MGNNPSLDYQRTVKNSPRKHKEMVQVDDIEARVADIDLQNSEQPPAERVLNRKKSTLLFDDESNNEEEYSEENEEEKVRYRAESISSTSSCSSHASDDIQQDEVCDRTEEATKLERQSREDHSDEHIRTATQSESDLARTTTNTTEVGIDESRHEKKEKQESSSSASNGMVPVEIRWEQGGEKVYVTGSFTNWRKMIGLIPVESEPGHFKIKLQLAPGTHRFRFIVDNQLRFSDNLPTATDQMGNFVNYLEVSAVPKSDSTSSRTGKERKDKNKKSVSKVSKDRSTVGPLSARSCIALEIEKEPDDFGDGYTRYHEELPQEPKYEFSSEIPAIFVDQSIIEQLTMERQRKKSNNMAWLTPPQLPPQLENVILNKFGEPLSQSTENNAGALPIPNHSVLNHLVTTSIKHNTLCVATNNRYRQKYVSQIYYVPL